MKTNSRFVVIDTKAKTATVFEDRRILAKYDFTENPLTKDDIEFARTQEYKDKA